METSPRIAVLLPCYNEGPAIPFVVKAFRDVLPHATIYVCDNNSTDNTANIAATAGATVLHEPKQGKGNVVLRMFADIEADIYVMADGDGTYDAASAPCMIDQLINRNLDMIVGVRKSAGGREYPSGHVLGNQMFTRIVDILFGSGIGDVFSGYRVMSRRFVKSFPSLSSGFEIEMMLNVHALELKLPIGEYDTTYTIRTEGTESKLRTFKDGFHILGNTLLLFKETYPFRFFSFFALSLFLMSMMIGLPVILEFFNTGYVSRVPSAILASGLSILGAISLTSGTILHSIGRNRLEQKRANYLKFPLYSKSLGLRQQHTEITQHAHG